MRSWDFLPEDALDGCEDCGHSSAIVAYEHKEDDITYVEFRDELHCYNWDSFWGRPEDFLKWSQDTETEDWLLNSSLTNVDTVKDFYDYIRAHVTSS